MPWQAAVQHRRDKRTGGQVGGSPSYSPLAVGVHETIEEFLTRAKIEFKRLRSCEFSTVFDAQPPLWFHKKSSRQIVSRLPAPMLRVLVRSWSLRCHGAYWSSPSCYCHKHLKPPSLRHAVKSSSPTRP